MSEFFTSYDPVKKIKVASRPAKEQLVFHMPESFAASVHNVMDEMRVVETIRVIEALKIIETMKSAQATREFHDVQMISEIAEGKVAQVPGARKEDSKISQEMRVVDVQRISHNKRIEHQNINPEELVNETAPFLSLNLKNAPEVYKIGKSYLSDLVQGKKNFGFSSIFEKSNDLNLLAIGSFVNYSLNAPVLIVVQDLNDKIWNQYRPNFKSGTLWKWQTCDWGNLCFIDYQQINRRIEEFNQINLDFITKEFAAILWALPKGNLQKQLPHISLTIIRQLNSITLTIKSGETKAKDLKEIESYYKCFEIPVKGILSEGVR